MFKNYLAFFIIILVASLILMIFPQKTAAMGMGMYLPDCPLTCAEPQPTDLCSISEPGTCNICTAGSEDNTCCSGGSPWTKYKAGCRLEVDACNWFWVYDTVICSTGDKCVGSETGLRAGSCDCGFSPNVYKFCCTTSGEAQSCITAGATQDTSYPPEGQCPGGYIVDGSRVRSSACTPITTPAPTSPPGGATPTPTPTPPPYIGGVCTPEDLINGSLSVPSGNVTSPVTVSGSYSGNRCANFTADPNQSYLAVDCTDVWNCPDSNRYPFSAISNDSFSKTLTLSPGTHKVSAHIEGYCPQWEKNAVAALPPNEPNCNRNFTVVAPTPTPSPPTLSNLKCSCPLPSNIAYLSWSATGAYTDFYYIVKETTGTWPASWQKTNIPSGDWPTTAGKSYQWLLSGCNGSSCSATYAIGPVCDCLAASQPPKPQISTPACITGNIPPTASTVKISWTNNATPVSWVDISEDNFSSAFHKDVTSSSLANSAVEVSAPVGFNGYLNIYGLLTVKPNQNYFVRTFNGSPVNNGHSPIASFNIPLCGTTPTPAPTSTPPPASPTSTPTPAPTAAPTAAPGAPASPEVDAVCGGTSATLTLNRPSGTTYYQVTINSVMIAPSFPALTDPIIFSYGPTGRGLTYLYFVAACNAAKLCSAPTSGNFTCSNAITPWIFVDGDVHSNTGINTPGGP